MENAVKTSGPDLYQLLGQQVPESYRSHVGKFVEFLRDNSHGLTHEGLAAYREYLGQPHEKDGQQVRYSASTINTYWAAALNRVNFVLSNMRGQISAAEHVAITEGIKAIKRKKIATKAVGKDKVLDYHQIRILIAELGDKPIATMIALMAFTGCRVSEMLGILQTDLRENHVCFKIRVAGKGGKERILEAEKELIKDIQERFRGKVYLFEDEEGKTYSRSTISMAVKRAGRKYLKREISAHTFRHSWATNAYKATKNVKAIQVNLGHSSPSTTIGMYVHDSFSFEQKQKLMG